MKTFERMTMTPLENAVWATAFVHGGPTFPLEHADQAVERLRKALHEARLKEILDDAKAMHSMQVMTGKNSGKQWLQCSCGYQAHTTARDDADDMMALHMAHVRALTLGETP